MNGNEAISPFLFGNVGCQFSSHSYRNHADVSGKDVSGFVRDDEMERLQSLNNLQTLGIVGLFSAFCNSLHYLLMVQEGRPFKWYEMLLNAIISFVLGVVVYEFVIYYTGVPPEIAGGLSGMFGWHARLVLELSGIVISRKFNVKIDESNKDSTK